MMGFYRDMGLCRKCCMERHGMDGRSFMKNVELFYMCDADEMGVVDGIVSRMEGRKPVDSGTVSMWLRESVRRGEPFETRAVSRRCPYYAEQVMHDMNAGRMKRWMRRTWRWCVDAFGWLWYK